MVPGESPPTTAGAGGRRLAQLAAIPVTELKGVGDKKAASLADQGIRTVLDLLMHYPRRYIDRTRQASIKDLAVGEEAMVLGQVRRVETRRTRARKTMVTVDVTDGSGYLKCTFFNQPWRASQLKEGTQAVLFGKVDTFGGRKQMTNPVVDLVGDRTGRIIPIYPQSEKAGLTTWELGAWIEEALTRAKQLADPVPDEVLDRWDLVDRTAALHGIHLPSSGEEHGVARRRLVFDELLRIQLVLVARKRELERTAVGIPHDLGGDLVSRFHERLPFPLTGAQRRAIADIGRDLASAVPMHRLLQGDVGSGKTLVAVSAMLVAVQGGHQGALMAPTEVLAEQHHLGIRALLEGFTLEAAGDNLFDERPLRVELLTNRTTAAERTRLAAAMAAGEVDIVIGTHALIEDKVAFRSLGVAVIDEQHRFGVEQRAALRSKGEAVPDVLVMTATPIPRTAAMTVYGDLDVSVLDELPPGRTPIATTWARGPLEEEAAWARVRDEVAAGRQAYVVAPLIDESEKLEVRSATETFEQLRAGELTGLRLALLHGRVPAKDKEAAMDAFRAREVDVLVATTVIEVGVDVPNATVMVIIDADRFGIAQLHQLRGRVGRGHDASWCYLLGAGATPEAETRLKALEDSTDGFALAEVDLDLRGEGTIMGARQKGRNDLRLASLRRDKEWVARARDEAFAIVDGPGGLEAHPVLAEELDVLLGDDEDAGADVGTEFLFKS
ncbi:MAG TPA: ATP-dependent DNA helicase RecG [Acidimicrobiales bacterium]|nr:ATP-dependent DNA helicase RecG [Acidimicrobiales bacterium]